MTEWKVTRSFRVRYTAVVEAETEDEAVQQLSEAIESGMADEERLSEAYSDRPVVERVGA